MGDGALAGLMFGIYVIGSISTSLIAWYLYNRDFEWPFGNDEFWAFTTFIGWIVWPLYLLIVPAGYVLTVLYKWVEAKAKEARYAEMGIKTKQKWEGKL